MNEPAFPEADMKICDNVMVAKSIPGLTKREYFAAAALSAVTSDGEYMDLFRVAADAVALADNLIHQLSQKRT